MFRSARRPRDGQKNKLYEAERKAFAGDTEILPSIEAAQEWVASIVATRWFRNRFPRVRCINVKKTHSKSYRAFGQHYPPASYIRIPDNDWGRQKWIIMHEVAHAVTDLDVWPLPAVHGRSFRDNYLKLVGRFFGKEAALRLRFEFRARGIRYRPKRKIAPETLKRLRDQAAILNATLPFHRVPVEAAPASSMQAGASCKRPSEA